MKTIASKNKTKKSRKSEVDSPDSPSFLGLGDEWKQKHIQKNDENQMKDPDPNPNRENREKRATERSFLFFSFLFV